MAIIPTNEEKVVLVNEKDQVTGKAGKTEAHQKGLLHRAFSIFIFNPSGELLLQKRTQDKYHSGRLWTNTCCSHPPPGGSLEAIVHKRLMEEMGFDCPLKKVFSFTYKAKMENGLTEHEFDHVFTGCFKGTPKINKLEVEAWKFVPLQKIREDLIKNPAKYTVWFKLALEKLLPRLQQNYPCHGE